MLRGMPCQHCDSSSMVPLDADDNWVQQRLATPGCKHVVHFNNAGVYDSYYCLSSSFAGSWSMLKPHAALTLGPLLAS